MRCIVSYKEDRYPPLLELYVFGAPHRRQHVEVIQKYRDRIIEAAEAAKIHYPIDKSIDLSVLFIDPTSTDLDNLITALYRALDGKALKKIGLLKDDGLIQKVTMAKFYPS